MPKRNRLSHDDLKNFKGKRLHGALFSLTFGPGKTPKAAFVVSKKVAAKAVERNKVKRRARAAFAKHAQDGMFLFQAKAAAVHATFREIENDMRELLGRASRS